MAITKIGPPLAGIRGTLGGITFSENQAGTYAKLWSPPSNPRSPHQTVQRGYLSRMPALWRDLTGPQRADWDTFAALPAQELTNSLGEAYYVSGYHWFCKTNLRLLRVGRAPNTTKPTQARPAAPSIDAFRVCPAGTESDLCTCGVATAESTDPTSSADNAFDDNLAVFWKTVVNITTSWLRYDLCNPANVKHYAIYYDANFKTMMPRDWTFEVFTGGAWEVLHTVTDVEGDQTGWVHFHCANPYTETDYRIDITDNNSSATRLIVMEMQFFLDDVGASVICYPEDDFEDTPSYDLILHIATGPSIGELVMYPGFYEILAIQDPGRWFELFQTQLEAVFGTITTPRPWWAQLSRQTTQGIRSTAQTERTETI